MVGFSASGTGVDGSSGGVSGVRGTTNATGASGVHGIANTGLGVLGEGSTGVQGTSTAAAGIGVYAESPTGIALSAVASTGGAASFQGGAFNLRLITNGAATPIGDGFAHLVGDVVMGKAGDLWLCTVAGSTTATTKWKKIGGLNTAGSFHLLPAPVRVYDSRAGTAPSTGPKTPLVGNQARSIDLKGNNSGVPAGATGAIVTILLLNTASGNGNFTLWANGVARPSGNSMVWGGAAGGRYTGKEVTALDANGLVQVFSSLKTDIALDVVGYYR